jgi:TRAP-type uncharacterized transport system fused permease subunit
MASASPDTAGSSDPAPTAGKSDLDGQRFRNHGGWLNALGTALLVAMPVCAILFTLEWYRLAFDTLWQQQFVAVFLGLVLAATFIYAPSTRSSIERVPWYDLGLAAVSFAICLYLGIYYPDLIEDAYSPSKAILGVVVVLLVFEATRRLVGWTIIITCVVFIVYAHYAAFAPGSTCSASSTWTPRRCWAPHWSLPPAWSSPL